jgi:hypothetical protein
MRDGDGEMQSTVYTQQILEFEAISSLPFRVIHHVHHLMRSKLTVGITVGEWCMYFVERVAPSDECAAGVQSGQYVTIVSAARPLRRSKLAL